MYHVANIGEECRVLCYDLFGVDGINKYSEYTFWDKGWSKNRQA